MTNYYDVLNITSSASQDEIKKAYRELAIKYHPDKPDGNESKFKEINDAYEILSDKDKKLQYDNSFNKKTYINVDDDIFKSYDVNNFYADFIKTEKFKQREEKKKKQEPVKLIKATLTLDQFVNGCVKTFKLSENQNKNVSEVNIHFPKNTLIVNDVVNIGNNKKISVRVEASVTPIIKDHYSVYASNKTGILININYNRMPAVLNFDLSFINQTISINKPLVLYDNTFMKINDKVPVEIRFI
jgi:curved DNA-binding protein CbpA